MVPPPRLAEHASGGMDAAQLRAALSGPSRGNVWGDDGGHAGASAWAEKRRLEGCAFLPCGVSLPRGQRKGGNPFKALRYGLAASVPTEKKQFAHTLIRLLSVVSVPEEKPPTRRKHAAFFVGGLRVVLKRAPVRFPEILLRMFPPRRQRRAPCPVPCVCVLLSSLSSIAGRNLCDAPRASWSSFAGACRSSGVFARRPITSTQAGRAQSRTPSRQRIALARAGRASGQDAGPFMVRGPATGRNAFSGTA